jgi:hypothetical protein
MLDNKEQELMPVLTRPVSKIVSVEQQAACFSRLSPTKSRPIIQYDPTPAKIKMGQKIECACSGSYYCSPFCRLSKLGAKPKPPKKNEGILSENEYADQLRDVHATKKKGSAMRIVARYTAKMAANAAMERVMSLMEEPSFRRIKYEREQYGCPGPVFAEKVQDGANDLVKRLKENPRQALALRRGQTDLSYLFLFKPAGEVATDVEAEVVKLLEGAEEEWVTARRQVRKEGAAGEYGDKKKLYEIFYDGKEKRRKLKNAREEWATLVERWASEKVAAAVAKEEADEAAYFNRSTSLVSKPSKFEESKSIVKQARRDAATLAMSEQWRINEMFST